MRTHWILSIAALALMMGGLSGCASPEEQAYKRARMTDTVVAWEDFLRRYPSGDETAKARQRLAELHEDHEWQRAGLANTVAAYQVYLRGYPQGRFSTEALVRIANLNLQDVPDHEPTPEELRIAQAVPPPVAPVSASPPASTATAKPIPAKRQGPTALIRRTPTTAPTPRIAPPRAAPPGTWAMQLGAFSKGEAAARSHWQKLQRLVPAVAGLSPEVVMPADGKPFHRLRVTGLEREKARTLCESIRAAGEGCLVTAP